MRAKINFFAYLFKKNICLSSVNHQYSGNFFAVSIRETLIEAMVCNELSSFVFHNIDIIFQTLSSKF